MRVFISYKSEDCNAVRPIVEALMAAGLPVWFAEYEVLPGNYDAFDADVNANLRHAVSQCTKAIVFSNDRWAASDYCRTEMRTIEFLLRPECVIEVRIPKEQQPHLVYPLLREGSPLEHTGNPTATAAALLERLGWPTDTLEAPTIRLTGECLRLSRLGLSVAPGPFLPEIKKSRLGDAGHGNPSVVLRAKIDGVAIDLLIILQPFDSVLRSLQIPVDGSAPDREVYNAYRRYAGQWEAEQAVNIRGLHLVFWTQRSQLAVTSTVRDRPTGESTLTWQRRYILSPRGQTAAEQGEISLLYQTADLSGTDEQQLRKFAALGPTFDQIVQSVRYEPTASRSQFVNMASTLIVRTAYLAACAAGIWSMLSQPQYAAWLTLLAMIGGSILTETMLVIRSPNYRQILWTLQPAFDDTFPDAYSRISASIPVEAICFPLLLIGGYLLDCAVVLRNLGTGTLSIPGPGLLWLLATWLLLSRDDWGRHNVMSSIGIALLAGCLAGLLVTLRFICIRTYGNHWRDLRLA